MSLLDELEEIAGATRRLTEKTRERHKRRTMDGIEQKLCGMCKAWKPLDLFYKHVAKRPLHKTDGYQNKCKACEVEYIRKYRRRKIGNR